MAITFPLTLPTAVRRPVSMTVRPAGVRGVNTSPGSLIAQVYEHPGERWEIDIELGVMDRQTGGAWAAFFTALRGPVGSFLGGNPIETSPIGGGGGTPLVSATTAARSRTLPIAGGTGTMRAGSMFSTGSGATRRLYMVLTDASLASATLDIWPALREQLSPPAALVLGNPTGRFHFAPGRLPEWTIDSKGYYRFAPVTAYEDLR